MAGRFFHEAERVDAIVGIATCFGALLVVILLVAIAPKERQPHIPSASTASVLR